MRLDAVALHDVGRVVCEIDIELLERDFTRPRGRIDSHLQLRRRHDENCMILLVHLLEERSDIVTCRGAAINGRRWGVAYSYNARIVRICTAGRVRASASIKRR